MVDQVTRALTPDQIAAIERRKKQVPDQSAGPVPHLQAFPSPVKFVDQDNKPRTLTVELDFPVEFNGETITEVVIRRPTNREWKTYIRACTDAVRESGPGADDMVDQVWMSVPAIVLEELDFVDATRVEAAQDGFFGRSTLPPEKEESASSSTSETGEPSPSP